MASYLQNKFAWLFNRFSVRNIIFLVLFISLLNSWIKSPYLQKAKTSFAGRAEEQVESISEVYSSDRATFKKEYQEMEKNFKIFIYPDGDEPRSLSGIYASEGYFFKNIMESSLITHDPNLAHLFFIPISCHKLIAKVKSCQEITHIVQRYVLKLAMKFEYWNKTMGADHFVVSCHESCTKATKGILENSIRLMCSSSFDNEFNKEKDISIPQVLQPFGCPPGGAIDTNRSILGYWEGNLNSVMRKRLVELWRDDEELDILKKGLDKDHGLLKCRNKISRSKFCLCPEGSLANSICITRAIYYGCIPVIFSDNLVLPFGEILNWEKFSVKLREDEVLNLKRILKEKAERDYIELQRNLRKVQRHFQWNSPALPYDAFHMVLYDLWLLISCSTQDYWYLTPTLPTVVCLVWFN